MRPPACCDASRSPRNATAGSIARSSTRATCWCGARTIPTVTAARTSGTSTPLGPTTGPASRRTRLSLPNSTTAVPAARSGVSCTARRAVLRGSRSIATAPATGSRKRGAFPGDFFREQSRHRAIGRHDRGRLKPRAGARGRRRRHHPRRSGHRRRRVRPRHPPAVERRLFGSDAERPAPEALEQIGETSVLYEALGGTLVLGNLSALPSRLQMRLARILRDGEVSIAAAEGPQRVDLRPIALVDANDDEAVIPDLRRQLSQTVITMPPLRERREDLPALIRLQLIDICAGLNLPPKRASRQAVALLSALPWPG